MDHMSSDRAAAESAEEEAAKRRAAPRDSLFLHAALRRAGDPRPLTIRVRNLSASGMMAEVDEPFTAGDRIEVELRGIGSIDGTVVWRRDHRIGVAFAVLIDPRRARKAVVSRPAAPPPAVPNGPRRPKLFGG